MNVSAIGFKSIIVLLALTGETIAGNEDSLRARVDYNQAGLGFQILLVSRNAIMENPSDAPKPETIYKRGDNVIPLITFRTEHRDQNGNADLTYDMSVFKPDSSLYGEFKQLIMIKGRAIPPDRYGFADNPPRISLDGESPVGVYDVGIVVHDNVRQVNVECKLHFQVVE